MRPAMIGVLLFWVSMFAHAQSDVTEDQMQEYFAGCAAAQSLVTVRMDSSLKDLILADARWFADRVQDKSRIEKMMRMFQDGYNDGNVTWRELVGLAEQCSEMKRIMLSQE